ncbi:MAG: DUF2087 domain-containing protein [Bacillota bacterium]
MTDMSELFWQASLQEIKEGYVHHQMRDEFICLICGESFAGGVVYPDGDRLYEARKYIKVHIAESHRSAFHFMLDLDKKLTGLTDHQKTILELFHEGRSDSEVAKALGTSASTVRNHRFSLREKQKQARVFSALMELLEEKAPRKQAFIEIPRGSKSVDERFAITRGESERILKTYFKQGLDGPLDSFPLKEKKRVAVLRHLLRYFEAGRNYTEKEVNAVLKRFYNDYAVLRRCLIDYGFMDRTPDGRSYWVKP